MHRSRKKHLPEKMKQARKEQATSAQFLTIQTFRTSEKGRKTNAEIKKKYPTNQITSITEVDMRVHKW